MPHNHRRHRVSSLLCNFLLALAWPLVAFGEANLTDPPFTLDSSASEVRQWANDEGFRPFDSKQPNVESFERQRPDGSRQILHYSPAREGLQMLMLQQIWIDESDTSMRQRIIAQLGEPETDDVLAHGALRLIYPISDTAQRIFMIQPSQITHMYVTDEYTASVNAQDSTQPTTQPEAPSSTPATPAKETEMPWLRYIALAVGIVTALFVLSKFRPSPDSGPLGKALGAIYDGSAEMIDGFVRATLTVTALVTGVGVFAAAIEAGTSWWWGLPWAIGAACYRGTKYDGGYATTVLAFVFFLGSMSGVILSMG